MKQKKAIISVINDLVTDQRVDRTARVLIELGYEVLMVGRQKSDSLRMPEQTYATLRLRLLWEKGPFFYAEYNIRLLFFLLGQNCSLLISNDLDTLLPNFLVNKIKNVPLVYDSHEYFTQTPEVIHRPFVQKVWKWIEKSIVPHLKYCITVNQSIAKKFTEEYKVEFRVVRNIPKHDQDVVTLSRKELGLPEDQKIVILQGAGINIQRGAEEAVEAMQYLEDTLLLIVGGGDVLPLLKKIAEERSLGEKVRFLPKQAPEKLFSYTCNSDLGLTLDKDTNLNYRFSLPNKLFDYIHAGIPVLASPLPEIKNIIETYQVGTFIENHDPQHIAKRINEILMDDPTRLRWKENAKKAAGILNWDHEKKELVELFSKIPQ